MSLEVSVVMATYRRPALLARCLRALMAQSLGAARYEVIVVDDGRDEATRAVVEEFAAAPANPALVYLQPLGTRGPAAARNRGWREARAPVIAFTDDDTVADRDWLLEGLRALAPGLPAVAGRIEVPVDGVPTDHARMTQGLARAEFATANVLVRRRALERVGGFDERFLRAWREDSDLHFTLIERYGHVGRAPRARVQHPVRPAPWGISLGQQANVCYDALLYRKHPALFKQKVRARPPWLYGAIVGCALAALGCALAGRWGWASVGVLLALAGSLAFAWARLRDTSRAPAHVAEMLLTSLAIPWLALYWRAVGAWRFKVLFP